MLKPGKYVFRNDRNLSDPTNGRVVDITGPETDPFLIMLTTLNPKFGDLYVGVDTVDGAELLAFETELTPVED